VSKPYRTIAAEDVLASLPPARQVKVKARAAEIVAEEQAQQFPPGSDPWPFHSRSINGRLGQGSDPDSQRRKLR